MSDNPTDYAYTGQQDAGDAANPFNADQFAIDQKIAQVSVATYVKVVKVTNTPGQLAAIGRVDVQPLVNQIDGDGNATPHGIIHGLSYSRYVGGKNAVIIDPEVGDIGLMVISDRDISSVKANQDAANPGSRRRHDMADGTYIGVPLSAKGNEVPEQYIRFTADGIEIKDKNGNKMEFASDGIHFTSVKVTNTGEITRGQGTGNQVSLGTHDHSDVTTGGDVTGPPVPGS